MIGVLIELILSLIKVLGHCLFSVAATFFPFIVPKKDISGQTVLVTGAGRGIGALMAKRIAALGARVVLWDVNAVLNESTAETIRAEGGRADTYAIDLSDPDEIEATAKRVSDDVGEVDIVINNAGIVVGKTIDQIPSKLISKVMEVNSIAVMCTTNAFLPTMLAKNAGHVVTIASAAGLSGCRKLADYCASKFAAVGFMESLSVELHGGGKDGVKTTVVCPYFIATGMFEGAGGRFPWFLRTLEPEEVADAVIDAMLKDQDFVLMPRILWGFYLLHPILPTKAALVLADFLGVTTFMDKFVGHSGSKKD